MPGRRASLCNRGHCNQQHVAQARHQVSTTITTSTPLMTTHNMRGWTLGIQQKQAARRHPPTGRSCFAQPRWNVRRSLFSSSRARPLAGVCLRCPRQPMQPKPQSPHQPYANGRKTERTHTRHLPEHANTQTHGFTASAGDTSPHPHSTRAAPVALRHMPILPRSLPWVIMTICPTRGSTLPRPLPRPLPAPPRSPPAPPRAPPLPRIGPCNTPRYDASTVWWLDCSAITHNRGTKPQSRAKPTSNSTAKLSAWSCRSQLKERRAVQSALSTSTQVL